MSTWGARAFCRVARTEPVENMWQYTWPNRLSNRVFDTYEAIIGAACGAWRRHFAQTTTITCIENEGLGHMSVSRHDRWFCLKDRLLLSRGCHLGGCLDVDHRSGEAIENMHYVKPDWEPASY